MTRRSLRRLQELARVNWRVRLINRKFPTNADFSASNHQQ